MAVEHNHEGTKFTVGCPLCKLQRAADRAVKALNPAAAASKRALFDRSEKRQRELYENTPKWGDAS